MYTPAGPGYGTLPSGAIISHDDARRFGLLPDVAQPPGATGPVAPPALPTPTFDMASAADAPEPSPPPVAAPAMDAAPPPPLPAPEPAPVAPPTAQPSAPNLSKASYGDVLAEQQSAANGMAAADARVAESEAGKLDAQAAALAERNAAIDAKQAEFAKREADDQKRIADTTSLYEAKVREFADEKVDRNKYKVSPLQAIGVALAGIGSAYKGQGDRNPALDLLMKQIDQYVEDGYKRKAAIGQEAAMYKDRLATLQDNASNTIAQKNLAVAGVTERTARELEAVGSRLDAGIKRDAVLQLAAGARAKGAEMLGQAVQLQHAEDRQKEAIAQQERESRRQAAVAYARIKEDARQADMNYAAKLADIEDQRAQRVAAATSASDAAVAELEIPDLYSKGADGSQALYQARTKEEATKIARSFAASQTLNDRLGELIRMKKAYGDKYKAMASPEWQKMQVNVADIQNSLRVAFEMGTLDKGSLEQMGKMMGGDPMRDGAVDALLSNMWKAGAENGLEQLRGNVVDRFNTQAKAMRNPRGPEFAPWSPPRAVPGTPKQDKIDEITKSIRGAETPNEMIDRAKPGAFWSAAGHLVGDGETVGARRMTNEEARAMDRAAANAADPAGFVTKAQQEEIARLSAMATTSKTDAASVESSARARAALIGLASDTNRPDLAMAALNAIAKSGDKDALAQVEAVGVGASPTKRDEEGARLRTRIATDANANPVATFIDRARQGDKAAIQQLVRASEGQDFGDVFTGFGKPTEMQRKMAMIELDAIARQRGRK